VASSLLHNCHGSRPTEVFEDVFAGGIVAMALAHESRQLLVATRRGHLSLLSQSGDRVSENLNYAGLSKVALSHSGEIGAAIVNQNKLVCFDQTLKPLWDASVTGRITGLAIAPHGSHIAFSTDSARLHIVTADRREVAKVETRRPMEHIVFLTEAAELIAAAEFGQMGRFSLKGKELWNEQLLNNVGDMCLADGAKRIFLAAFNHGVQVYNRSGEQLGTFAIDGIPSRVSASATKSRVAVLTLENRIYWLNFDGEIQWAVDVSQDPPQHICTGPLGDRLFIATKSGCLLQVSWP